MDIDQFCDKLSHIIVFYCDAFGLCEMLNSYKRKDIKEEIMRISLETMQTGFTSDFKNIIQKVNVRYGIGLYYTNDLNRIPSNVLSCVYYSEKKHILNLFINKNIESMLFIPSAKRVYLPDICNENNYRLITQTQIRKDMISHITSNRYILPEFVRIM